MWRVTPPGYVHEYGETRAIRIGANPTRRPRGRMLCGWSPSPLAVPSRPPAGRRGMSADGDAKVRIAIIGSGPGRAATRRGTCCATPSPTLHVDLFERLPTPWGLVRAGVAPDHPKIKSVTRLYERTAEHPRLRLFAQRRAGPPL